MTEDEDLDGLAAEYVLGSLSLAERQEVDARRRRDATLDRAVADWERRLAPLSNAEPGIAPPPELFAAIQTRLWGMDRPTATIIPMPAPRRSLARRVMAAGASAVAACLLIAVVWQFLKVPATPMKLVAELHRSAGTAADEGAAGPRAPGFQISIDLDARSMVVSPAALRATPRRSFQLWLLKAGGAPPVSLGLISHATPTRVPWREDYPTSGLVDETLAVSLEPEGGSPAGAPTGPILFVGKLATAP